MASEFLGYERGRLLLESIGTFWSSTFRDKDVLQNHLEGVGSIYGQRYFDLLEIVLAKSIFDIPVFHREKWTCMPLPLSMNTGLGMNVAALPCLRATFLTMYLYTVKWSAIVRICWNFRSISP